MTNLDSVLKSRDITLLTKVCIVKAMFFPVVMYCCESWTIKKVVCMLNHFSHVWLFATLWTVAHQAPLSMRFSRQDCWSGLSCPPAEDLPNWGIRPVSHMSPALAGGFFTTSTTWEALSLLLDIGYFYWIFVIGYFFLHFF